MSKCADLLLIAERLAVDIHNLFLDYQFYNWLPFNQLEEDIGKLQRRGGFEK